MELSKNTRTPINAKSPTRVVGLFLFALIGCWLSVVALDPGRDRPRAPYLSPPQIQYYTFGMKEQSADILWLRALQDFDYCEREVAKQVCASTGWLFRMLDIITDLAPRFRMPYATGGLALTVLVNDFPGASRIFEKAVAAFPKDWPLLSRAAYHALYEEKDNKKAARLLRQAAQSGGPPWYYLLANRLSLQEGDRAFAEEIVRQLEREPNPDPVLLKSLKRRLEEGVIPRR